MEIWGYKIAGEDTTAFDKVIAGFPGICGSICRVYTDEGKDRAAYAMWKHDAAGKTGMLVTTALRDLGGSPDDIYRELKWLQEQGTGLIAADMPSTVIYDRKKNMAACAVLIDVYRGLCSNVADIRTAQARMMGRPRAGFPDGWADLYAQWKDGQITAKEFMTKAGVKKGTFYHLAEQWKAVQTSAVEIRKIG